MLNSQQMAAVRYIDGPLLVLAGAGSGKTRVITQKIAYLINTCGYAASSIFAVTFTNKAANEMRARVAASIPAANRRGLKVATFHTLGLSMIKRNVDLCDLKKAFLFLIVKIVCRFYGVFYLPIKQMSAIFFSKFRVIFLFGK